MGTFILLQTNHFATYQILSSSLKDFDNGNFLYVFSSLYSVIKHLGFLFEDFVDIKSIQKVKKKIIIKKPNKITQIVTKVRTAI